MYDGEHREVVYLDENYSYEQTTSRRQIVEGYPDSPYANQAKTRLAELEKAH